MGSRRFAYMIQVFFQFFDVYIFTTNSVGDLDVPISESKIYRIGKIDNEIFQKTYKRNFIHKIISLFTEDIRSIDTIWISLFFKNRKSFLQCLGITKPDYDGTIVGSYSTGLFGKSYCSKIYKDIPNKA
jgi:hypothetical protein